VATPPPAAPAEEPVPAGVVEFGPVPMPQGPIGVDPDTMRLLGELMRRKFYEKGLNSLKPLPTGPPAPAASDPPPG
jgi:hypothetical protein